jgi:alpha-L-arabinofuranosidase
MFKRSKLKKATIMRETMQQIRFSLVKLGVAVGLAMSAGQVWAGPAKITIQVDKPGARISPLLYGIFFEDINRAGDGGINSELLRNPTFEEGRDLAYNRVKGAGSSGQLFTIRAPADGLHTAEPRNTYPWRLEFGEGAESTINLDLADPLSLHNPTSLRLSISKPGAIRLINEGFGLPVPDKMRDCPGWANTKWPENMVWGFPVSAQESYPFLVYARCGDGFSGDMTVRLETSEGKVLASERVRGIGATWKPFTGVLKPNTDAPVTRFVIVPESVGTLWLDGVSLKPATTWKNHGLRKDLMEMIAAMKPAFVRFPGGCFVEGRDLSSKFDWKDTIGEQIERPGHWNLWGYWSTDAVGYYEYLQMCEDLGAEPLYVANCGIAHKDCLPVAHVYKALQDALDAIEYANGPVTSTWGAKRAQAGHPAPFNLKYLQIGNENGGPIYDDAYAIFYDVMKKQHPEVHLIACNWPRADGKATGPLSRPIEILDEHYYMPVTKCLEEAYRYDSYDRKGPKIYIGEFAVTSENGAGNLNAALAESAFMLGMERNSDVVVMGSYAPLLAHQGYVAWTPANAIYFDAGRAFGTPSYWAQVLFAQNRADANVAVTVDTPEAYLGGVGCVGLASTSDSEFKDLVVTAPDGKELYRSDFSKGMQGFECLGKWETRDGVLHPSNPHPSRVVAGNRREWTNYSVSVQARRLKGDGGFGLCFQMPGLHYNSVWNVDGKSARFSVGSFSSPPVPIALENGKWQALKLEITGPTVRGFISDKLIQEVKPRPALALQAVAGTIDSTGEVVVKVVNLSDEPLPTDLNIQGAKYLQPKGKAIILSGKDKDTENDFIDRTAAGIKVSEVNGLGSSFSYTFSPNAVTVLRLPVKEMRATVKLAPLSKN